MLLHTSPFACAISPTNFTASEKNVISMLDGCFYLNTFACSKLNEKKSNQIIASLAVLGPFLLLPHSILKTSVADKQNQHFFLLLLSKKVARGQLQKSLKLLDSSFRTLMTNKFTLCI